MVVNLILWRFGSKVEWRKGTLTMHLIHHILVWAPTLNSDWRQCHALGGVAQGWGNWIGIRHWVSDNKRYPSLSHGLSALLWLPGILFAHSLSSSEADKHKKSVGRATGTGSVWWSRVLAVGMASPVWAPVHGCVNPGFPQSPGVICVIITIITLRLQEISTVASEEEPSAPWDNYGPWGTVRKQLKLLPTTNGHKAVKR